MHFKGIVFCKFQTKSQPAPSFEANLSCLAFSNSRYPTRSTSEITSTTQFSTPIHLSVSLCLSICLFIYHLSSLSFLPKISQLLYVWTMNFIKLSKYLILKRFTKLNLFSVTKQIWISRLSYLML